jgi:hypothetical protein
MRLRRRVVGYCDEGPDFAPTAAGSQFVGNIVVMMWAYARSRLGEQTIPFEHCNRVIGDRPRSDGRGHVAFPHGKRRMCADAESYPILNRGARVIRRCARSRPIARGIRFPSPVEVP